LGPLRDMQPDPVGERFFVDLTSGQCDDRGDHVGITSSEFVSVESQEHGHHHERNALVAIVVGMVAGETVAVGSGKRRQVRSRLVGKNAAWAVPAWTLAGCRRAVLASRRA